ncbi:hypothetical protein ACI799_01560 [Blastococcus sp. SYSU DS0753]
MSRDQKWNNRSQGQRIRRNREDITALADGLEGLTGVVGQHDRDMRFQKANYRDLEARVAKLERERSRK